MSHLNNDGNSSLYIGGRRASFYFYLFRARIFSSNIFTGSYNIDRPPSHNI